MNSLEQIKNIIFQKGLSEAATEFFEVINTLEAEFKVLDGNIITVKKWNWDYQEALDFQKTSMNFVRVHKAYKVYIFCNHPHCYTMGRGLQKGQIASSAPLISFSPADQKALHFPLIHIKRGGGLTFHYPGQWIFYPIVNLGRDGVTVNTLLEFCLLNIVAVLKEHFDLPDATCKKDYLGVWSNDHKIASMGLGIERFVTSHGVALNLLADSSMFNNLAKINPCGLKGTVYTSVEDLIIASGTKSSKRPILTPDSFFDYFFDILVKKAL
ncbi:MAG: lipoyl(octanoyl) transferase LipB [Bacteriovoracaceae bacterium]|nr:lipoyl(octanoyl) transferase LipB [Bacteriovoracaceae bacterium]